MSALRICVGCPAQLDLAAQLDGILDQPGWHRTCCGYICPDCLGTGHYPHYRAIAGTTTAHPTCGCGWVGDVACDRLSDIGAEWSAHYLSARLSPPPDSVPS